MPIGRVALAVTLMFVFNAVDHASPAAAAPPPPATTPASRPAFAPGWDAIDDRLIFLTAQLASVEASIDAVTKQLRITRNGQAVKGAQADGHRKANEQMDRNMGMPATIRWEKFYGRTADKFFYHPTDNRTSYHTLTVLGQRNVGNTDDKPDANGGVPAHQRPPQFDYLYRANNERRAMAEAEAAKLAGRLDLLAARRRELEAEQAALWCKVSARAVAYRNLLTTRLYRFDVKAPDDAELSRQRVETFRVAVRFLRVANQLMIDADERADVSTSTYTRTLKASIGKARAELDERLVKQPLLAFDVTDVETWVGKLTAVVRRMDDLSRNVVDSDRLALDGDAAGDEQRKHTFRQSLQDQLLILAQGVLAGDECVTAMRQEWKLEFDPAAPLAAAVEMPKVEVAADAPQRSRNPNAPAVTNAEPRIIDMVPRNGSEQVDPLLKEIRITFDQPMSGGYSFAKIGGNYPVAAGDMKARWVDDRTCVLPVLLSPGRPFRLSINTDQHQGFRSRSGIPLKPVVWSFTTWIDKGPGSPRKDTTRGQGSNAAGDARQLQKSEIDLLREYELGRWTDLASKGSWSQAGGVYEIIPRYGSGTDFAFTYPLDEMPSFRLTMLFRMASKGAIKINFTGGPSILDGKGVYLSYAWNKGFFVGDIQDRKAIAKIVPLQRLDENWHTLVVVVRGEEIAAKIDDGKPVSASGIGQRPFLMLAGDGFEGLHIKQMTLKPE